MAERFLSPVWPTELLLFVLQSCGTPADVPRPSRNLPSHVPREVGQHTRRDLVCLSRARSSCFDEALIAVSISLDPPCFPG